jgi:hypothetical protein
MDARNLQIQIDALNEKFKLLMDEAEKRNGQRFDAQQEAVATAMVAQEKAVLAAMAAAEKAVTKAEVAAEKRFESVNEFRKTLSDQTSTFITRDRFDGVVERIDVMDKRISESTGRDTGKNSLWLLLTGGIAIMLSAASVIILFLKTT